MDREKIDWVSTNADDGTIDDGGVKIHLLSYDDSQSEMITRPVPFEEVRFSRISVPFFLQYRQPSRKEEFETLSLPIDFDGLKDQFASQVAGTVEHFLPMLFFPFH
jgi:hypothetical protein